MQAMVLIERHYGLGFKSHDPSKHTRQMELECNQSKWKHVSKLKTFNGNFQSNGNGFNVTISKA